MLPCTGHGVQLLPLEYEKVLRSFPSGLRHHARFVISGNIHKGQPGIKGSTESP